MQSNGDMSAHGIEPTPSFGRRIADLTHQVRSWADHGTVHPRVAARFVRVRIDEQARRVSSWQAAGGERRRRDD